jgi:hypothetical protein
MPPLTAPDSHHLRAAIGWLELGNHLEANEELEKITASLRAHPDVLEVRWQICARELKWDACLDIAVALVQTAPERPAGWIHRSVYRVTFGPPVSGGLLQVGEVRLFGTVASRVLGNLAAS